MTLKIHSIFSVLKQWYKIKPGSLRCMNGLSMEMEAVSIK